MAKAVRRRIDLAGQCAAVEGNLTGREKLRLIWPFVHSPRGTILAAARFTRPYVGVSIGPEAGWYLAVSSTAGATSGISSRDGITQFHCLFWASQAASRSG